MDFAMVEAQENSKAETNQQVNPSSSSNGNNNLF